MNDNDFKNESQRYFDEMMKLYAKSGNTMSNITEDQPAPALRSENITQVNKNNMEDMPKNTEFNSRSDEIREMPDNNQMGMGMQNNAMREMPDNNLMGMGMQNNAIREMPDNNQMGMGMQNNAIREMPDNNQMGMGMQNSAMREMPDNNQMGMNMQNSAMREMPDNNLMGMGMQSSAMREMPDNNQMGMNMQNSAMREMPDNNQMGMGMQSSAMREMPDNNQMGMNMQSSAMREMPERNSIESQTRDMQQIYENEQNVPLEENINSENSTNFENRFPAPVIPDFIRESVRQNSDIPKREADFSSFRTSPTPSEPVNNEYGFLKVEVRTGENGIPVPGAAVTVEVKNGEEGEILFTGITDDSGSVPTIKLPAPPMGNGKTPDSFRNYSTYAVSAYMKGFYRGISQNVPVFSGITSIQRFNLIPEPFNFDDMGRSIVNENTEPNF